MTPNQFRKASVIPSLVMLGLYLPIVYLYIGFSFEHYFILSILIFAFFYSDTSHKFFWCTIGFTLFAMAFDASRVYPNYLVNEVHIKELFDMELNLFGITHNGELLTPHQYLALFPHPLLDFFSGLCYLMWMPGPLGLTIYFFIKKRAFALKYNLAFLLTCVLGMTVYYLYPAAPPWYVDLHGFDKNFDIPGSAAGLLAFDDLTGLSIFSGIYDKSANVFAAVPSLHSSYPLLSVYYCVKSNSKAAFVFMFFVLIWTWFGAVYTAHHYVIDVLLGILCACSALFLFEYVIPRSPLKTKLNKWINYIS